MPRWVHFSREPLGPLRAIEQRPMDADRSAHEKPHGLWVSDEDPEAGGWREWCEAEEFMLDRWQVAQEIVFYDDAKLLRLNNALEIVQFTDKYGTPDWVSRRHPEHRPALAIDWRRVSEEYDGILITPYCWRLRLETKTTWYYTWDCASGCIWNPRAIALIGNPEPATFAPRVFQEDGS